MAFAGKIDEILARLGETRPIEVITFPIDPTYTIPPNTLAYERERVPGAVMILSVTIHWPPGCEGLVDVRIDAGRVRVLPVGWGEWLSKDDATITYTINKPYPPLKTITVYWRNRDTNYAHRVSVDLAFSRRI